MSGHSKWSTIKHKKAAIDAKRGAVFTKVIKEITIAARMGGGDPGSNPRLRAAMLNARAANMPKDNVERAIKKGTGELGAVIYEDVNYEGYGPGGVALIIEITTDNKNRTASEIRSVFFRANSTLAAPGAVAWKFKRLGQFLIERSKITEDKLMEVALDAGADDVTDDGDNWVVTCDPNRFMGVREKLEAAGIVPEVAEVMHLADDRVKVSGKEAEQIVRLVENLEAHDDVNHVWANFDIDDKELEQLMASA